MNLLKKKSKKDLAAYELQQEMERVKAQIDTADNHFQSAVDPDLIDCYIYESNAAWKRYHFLLKQAKML